MAGLYILPYGVMLLHILYVWATQGWSTASALY
jgi:hypothetical protein